MFIPSVYSEKGEEEEEEEEILGAERAPEGVCLGDIWHCEPACSWILCPFFLAIQGRMNTLMFSLQFSSVCLLITSQCWLGSRHVDSS